MADQSLISSVTEGREPSVISDHGERCCEAARAWVHARDRAHQDGTGQPPSWLKRVWKWGPNPWPLYWCDVVRRDSLDCGGLAALTRQLMERASIPHLAVQLLQRYELHDGEHWKRTWEREGLAATWVTHELAYHEAVAIPARDVIEVWDPTDEAWVGPLQSYSYGGTIAVRLVSRDADGTTVLWHGTELAVGEWLASPFDPPA
jgi:hypothetical protein